MKYQTVNDLPDWVKMITGGVAGSIAEIATIPVDTAKVRLQIQKPDTNGLYKYKGLLKSTALIYKEEGILSLYKGLVAGIQRQMVFASIRIGLYEPVKIIKYKQKKVRNFYCGKDFKGDPPLSRKILAGLTTGAIGISIASPFDVIKIRFQSDGNLPVSERRYTNLTDAYIKIYKLDGLAGFWKGVMPNIVRNSIINCAELATFDQAKESLLKTGLFNDGIYCHLTASAIAGVVACTVGQPVDLIKTRVMNFKVGIIECIVNAIKNDGLLSFYNGYSANAGRIVSWNMVMFVSLGQIRLWTYNKFYKGH